MDKPWLLLACLFALLLPAFAQLQVSPEGTCGAAAGFTCFGSEYGDCCSEHGWCGSTGEHCAGGCQISYGHCDPGDNSTYTRSGNSTTTQPASTLTQLPSSPAVPGVMTTRIISVIYVTSTIRETKYATATTTTVCTLNTFSSLVGFLDFILETTQEYFFSYDV